jgi:small subunit ribosomal protein S17
MTQDQQTQAEPTTESSATDSAAASSAVQTSAVQTSAAETGGERTRRKSREGLVVSDKMDKTVVVSVEDRVKHALYGKVLRRTSRLKAHDETNSCGTGDRVLIMETRPLSATKRWRVVQVLEKAK